MKTFFLRCDDVVRPDRSFLRVYRLLRAAELPVSCAVIPAQAVPALAAFFNSETAAGARLEALQHGLSHAEHSGNKYLKQEFGPARPYKEQKADIAAGKKLMKNLFGKSSPVFVPPFHLYNSDTLKALASLGFKAVSASRRLKEQLPRGLAFLGTRVTVNEYGLELEPRPLSLNVLKSRTLAAMKEGRAPAGIYFHHDDIRGKDLEIFSAYLSFLKDLEERGLARFVLASETIKRPVRS